MELSAKTRPPDRKARAIATRRTSRAIVRLVRIFAR
jgi:hypothetical protein